MELRRQDRPQHPFNQKQIWQSGSFSIASNAFALVHSSKRGGFMEPVF
jgi:hypothetical protein